MKQLVAAYSNFDAPKDGLGCFNTIFDYGKDAASLDSFNHVDALVLWGGADISPSFYKEDRIYSSGPINPTARDLYEWELIKEAVSMDIPIIGVCRGAQLLCAYAGGKLIQDVTGHQISHKLTTYDGETLLVNSYHHQMMYPYDVEHELLAWTTKKQATTYLPDTTEHAKHMLSPSFEEPEVVFFPEVRGFAVQCHPEWQQKTNPFNIWMDKQILSLCFKE